MTVLVTGAAGFIGYHVSEFLLDRGETVVGLDAVTDYYDVALKEARISRLERHDGFALLRIDLADREAVFAALAGVGGIDRVVHLAAQAGVRHSRERPFAYVDANLVGHMTVLEYCRHLPGLKHLVYASSSSVYGANAKLPFAVEDRTDSPISLYAATKRANEHMSYCYSHLYGIPQTGLRFFTVYGPWGRPDMALYLFTRAILEGRPIEVFNDGAMKRDFTYIDDVVPGVVAALDSPPDTASDVPHRLYNIGNNRPVWDERVSAGDLVSGFSLSGFGGRFSPVAGVRRGRRLRDPEPLMRLIGILEDSLGLKAEIDFRPLQPGDVEETYADISASRRDEVAAVSASLPSRRSTGRSAVRSTRSGAPIDARATSDRTRFVDWFRRP